MKDYVEWLGMFAVSGCLALVVNAVTVAHSHPAVTPGSSLAVKTELRQAFTPTRRTNAALRNSPQRSVG